MEQNALIRARQQAARARQHWAKGNRLAADYHWSEAKRHYLDHLWQRRLDALD
jgi:hypothetical protein